MLNEKQVVDDAERSFIRSAIYSLPAKWKIVGLVVVLVVTYFWGGK